MKRIVVDASVAIKWLVPHKPEEANIYKAFYQTGIRLSIELNHHLFDTLYHAVALHTPDATLITADEAYWRKAQTIGQIVRLVDYAA